MTVDASDKIKRAYARISGIRKNIGAAYHVDREIVDEYMSALKHLEDLGLDMEEFKIPLSWLKRPLVSSGPAGPKYANVECVKRDLFVTKIDAVLEYFTLPSGGGVKDSIGFKAR